LLFFGVGIVGVGINVQPELTVVKISNCDVFDIGNVILEEVFIHPSPHLKKRILKKSSTNRILFSRPQTRQIVLQAFGQTTVISNKKAIKSQIASCQLHIHVMKPA
jgi:hypothetical protein